MSSSGSKLYDRNAARPNAGRLKILSRICDDDGDSNATVAMLDFYASPKQVSCFWMNNDDDTPVPLGRRGDGRAAHSLAARCIADSLITGTDVAESGRDFCAVDAAAAIRFSVFGVRRSSCDHGIRRESRPLKAITQPPISVDLSALIS